MMATQSQREYIADLTVIKTKEFKEVKELLLSNDIISDNAEIVLNAQTINEITNALDANQASKLIDVLIDKKTPQRSSVYSDNRVNKTMDALDSIKDTIANWDFE